MTTPLIFRPQEILDMGLITFEHHFGFRPSDLFEKYWFAMMAYRPSEMERVAYETGLFDPETAKLINMEE